jgi:hypothetical protein
MHNRRVKGTIRDGGLFSTCISRTCWCTGDYFIFRFESFGFMSEGFCDLIQPLRITSNDFDSRKGRTRLFSSASGVHTYSFFGCKVAGVFKLVAHRPSLRMRGSIPTLTHKS